MADIIVPVRRMDLTKAFNMDEPLKVPFVKGSSFTYWDEGYHPVHGRSVLWKSLISSDSLEKRDDVIWIKMTSHGLKQCYGVDIVCWQSEGESRAWALWATEEAPDGHQLFQCDNWLIDPEDEEDEQEPGKEEK